MIKEIITDLDLLSNRADEIDVLENKEEVNQIVQDLKDTILENKLIFLTAPQIGYNKRIFCLNFNSDIRTFINPMIKEIKEMFISREACPSIPGKEFIVPRHKEIVALYQTPVGKSEANRFLSPASELFEHCQDLLEGVTLADYGLEVDEVFDKASEEEKEELIKAYLNMLDSTLKMINKEIDEDEDLKKTKEAIDFMTSVALGETEVVQPKPIKVNRAARRAINRAAKKLKRGK